jgi:hypothetical protein
MIKLLRMYDPILQKVRVGNFWDGGYVLALQSLGRSSALFSYGVGTDISFEKAYVDATNKYAFCFDHTIQNIDIPVKYAHKLIYTKEGISGVTQQNTKNFIQHYQERGFSDRVLFKCDVEGAEYEFLENTDIEKLASITTGLIFEFHYLEDPAKRERFFNCVEKLNQYYYLCHVHGNNYSSNFVYEEIDGEYKKQYSVPNVIELSFVNKDLVSDSILDKKNYPCDYLDRKNDLSKLELDLSFLKVI